MIMVYPLLVQVDYTKAKGYYIAGDWAKSWKPSKGGKAWTFKLRPDAKWSDGQPMTAADAAWTINTTIKYAEGATAVQATALNHAKSATAPNSTTLVINYEAPVGNALWLIAGMPIVPRHVWEPYEKKQSGGKALKTYRPEGKLPMVTGGAYTIKQYEKKGTTVFIPDPNFYGPKSNADAVALTFYTNSDSMIAELRQRQSRLDRPGAVRRGQRRQEEQGREGQPVARRRDHEHHVELELAQAQEPRAPRPAGEEGALDVRRTATR